MPRELIKGLLVAIEGIDGAGKTTQVQELFRRLSAKGFDVVCSKEPTNGPWGKQLRKSATEGRLGPREELDLFILDRKEHVQNLIQPALDRRAIVILDRYYFSTIAYQGVRGMDPAQIQAENEAFAPAPDILIVLDLDAGVAIRRIVARDEEGANHFERIDLLEASACVFQECVNACPRTAPDGRKVRSASVDATKAPGEIADEVEALVLRTAADQIAESGLSPEEALSATVRVFGGSL